MVPGHHKLPVLIFHCRQSKLQGRLSTEIGIKPIVSVNKEG